jgi:archaetidylinositol phosphate synthase
MAVQEITLMQREQFAGASKSSVSLISPLERRMARAVVPRIPAWLETQHLTMLTLLWCAGLILFGYLAARDLRWLWGANLMIFLQYLSDFFDGKVGKHRGTGLVKWGFYMDHMLDFVFLCAVIIGYALFLPERALFSLLLVLAVYAGLMVNSFLTFAATEKFEISHLKIGPTEFRMVLIATNALLVVFGPRPLKSALPYVAAGSFVALCMLVYRTQKMLWRRDMEYKEHNL